MVKIVRRMRMFQFSLITIFIITLFLSIVFAVLLNIPHFSLASLLIAFPIALIIAIYGSLSIREEEEET